MSLSASGPLVRQAREARYAVPAVNTSGADYDIVRAIVEVAEQERSPVILMAYGGNMAYQGMEYAGLVMRYWAERASVPIAVHLDHATCIEDVWAAMDAGFTSVMFDGSKLPLAQNLALTKQVVDRAGAKGVSVEAEVGELLRLGPDGAVPEPKNLANPGDVERMSKESGADMLAVGIGNAHGFYKGKPNIRLDLLEKLEAASTVPLVLHGTTGIPEDVLKRAIEIGIAKVNLGTLVRTNHLKNLALVIAEDPHEGHPWRVRMAAKELLKTDIRNLIRSVGSGGRV